MVGTLLHVAVTLWSLSGTSSVTAAGIGAQPQDATLTALGGASCVADRVLYCDGADSVASGTLTAAARSVLDDATTGAMLTTLGAQPLDATTTGLAAMVTDATPRLVYSTAADTFSASAVSAFSLTLFDEANAAAWRTELALVPGTNVQAHDADLTTYGGITPSANVQTMLGAADNAAICEAIGVGVTDSPQFAGASFTNGDLTSIDEIALTDGAGAATAAGRLRRNGTTLSWHDGTAGRVVYAASGTDVAVADGGTGASAAGTALDNVSGLAATGLVARTGAGAYSARTITGTANQITVSNGDGVAAAPGLSLDATIGGIGALAWTSGSQVPVLTAADTWSLTTLPTAGTFDWAASSSYVPESADWTDHRNWDGQDAAVTFAEVESGKLIRIVPDDGAENDGQGICRTIGAGNFRVGARLGLSVKGIDWDATASYCDFHLVFVDGTDLNPAGGGSDFYGAGLKVENDTHETFNPGTVTATDWDTDILTYASESYTTDALVDVILERTGTDLVTYIARHAGSSFYQLGTFTVTAGAGLICFRINQQSAAPHAWRGFVHAYAHTLSQVPGWE